MIILEGPDGCGKTTLLSVLTDVLRLEAAPRASIPGIGVPKDRDLVKWVNEDMGTWHKRPCEVHDRYPLISEPIYGSYVRGRPSLRLDGWYRGQLDVMRRSALVIFCLPPYEIALKNAQHDRQMDGVLERYDAIYAGYQWLACMWGGHRFTFNYTHGHTALSQVMAHAKQHKENWYV